MEFKDDGTVAKDVIETFLKGVKEAEQLINNGVDINFKDSNSESVVEHAIAQGNSELVTFLLDNGAEISEAAALQSAHYSDKEDVIVLLIQRFSSAIERRPNDDYLEALEYCITDLVGKPDKHKIIEEILNNSGNLADYTNKCCYDPLLIACEEGYKDYVCLLLDKGADLYNRNGEIGNALHSAASSNNSDLVEWLLSKGFKVNEENESGVNALSIAVCCSDNPNIVEVLLKNGAKFNVPNSQYYNPLLSACEDGNEAIVKLIIESGADINKNWDRTDDTPLQVATKKGHENVVKLLLKSGAKITASSTYLREGILHMAVTSQKEKLVELFLQRGLKVNKKHENGETALELACSYDNTEVIKLLLQYATDVGEDLYLSSLKCAINSHKENVAKLLLELAAIYIDLSDVKQLEDLLLLASSKGRKNIVEILLDLGLDINCKDQHGHSVLYHAVCSKNMEIVGLLLKKNAIIEEEILKASVIVGFNCIIQKLLQQGLDINWKDQNGHSVLYHAVCSKNMETVGMLLEKNAVIEEEILQASVKHGFNCIIQKLLKQGLNINWRKNVQDFSALEASVGNFELFKTLWNHGRYASTTGHRNVPVLNLACFTGNIKVVKLLLSKGADTKATDTNGINCLVAAVDGGNLEVVKLLLAKGIDLEFRDSFGRTALSAALINSKKNYKYNAHYLRVLSQNSFFDKDDPKYVTIVEFLLDYGATLDVKNQNDCENFLFACEIKDLSKLKLLLAYDVHINFVNKLWAGLMESSNWSETGKIITQFVVKAQSKCAFIEREILVYIIENDSLRVHRHECEEEIKLMKEKTVGNSRIHFNNILITTDLNQLAEYASDDEILKAFSVHYRVATECRAMFPIYFDEMRYQIKKGLWRKYLLNNIVASGADEALLMRISASNRELQAQGNNAKYGIHDVFVNYRS